MYFGCYLSQAEEWKRMLCTLIADSITRINILSAVFYTLNGEQVRQIILIVHIERRLDWIKGYEHSHKAGRLEGLESIYTEL